MDADENVSIRKNYLYNLSYQILAILVPLITTPYIARVLGPAALGDYAYTSANVSYFGMVAVLGTAIYAQREIAFVQKKRDERSRLFWEIFILRITMTCVVCMGYCVFLHDAGKLRYLYLIQLCTVFSWAADISWFFQGMENFRVTVMRNTLVKLASVCLIFLLVKKEEDLWLYVLIVCGSVLMGNLTLWPFLTGYLGRVQARSLHPLRHLRGALGIFVPTIGIQVYTVLDQTMLGTFIDTTQVGYYTQAQKIVKLASTVLYALTAVLLPRMSAVVGERKWTLAREYYEKILYFSIMLILPMMAGCILIAGYLVPVFLGDNYEPCIRLLRIFSLLFITQGIGQIAGTLLLTLKKQKAYTMAVMSGAAINFTANIFLIPRFGAYGAAAASVFAELCVELLMLRGLKPEFKNMILVKIIRHYLPPTAFMSLGMILAGRFLEVNLLSLIMLGGLGIMLYGVQLVLCRDASLRELLRRK